MFTQSIPHTHIPPSFSQVGAWVLHALHGAKLSMLLLPEAYLVLPSVLLALAVTAPAFVYEADVAPLPASGAISAGGCTAWNTLRWSFRVQLGGYSWVQEYTPMEP